MEPRGDREVLRHSDVAPDGAAKQWERGVARVAGIQAPAAPPDRTADLLGVDGEAASVSRRLAQSGAARNIAHDAFDDRTWRDLNGSAERLREIGGKRSNPWGELLADVFCGYYKGAPELRPADEIGTAGRANRPIIERFLQDPETAQARSATMLDELSSALATAAFAERLLTEAEGSPPVTEALTCGHLADPRNRERSPVNPAKLEVEQAMAADRAEEVWAQQASALRAAVHAAAEAGADKAVDFQVACAGWGLEPTDLRQVDPAERFDIAERLLTPHLRELAALVGRIRNLARGQRRTRVKHGQDEVHRIGVGDDLAHLLPAELGALTHPLRKLDFYRRFGERSLLQYELRSKERVGYGPMVLLLDCSGSMGGQRMNWAVAVTLSLLDTARQQRRAFMLVPFNGRVLPAIEWRPGERDVAKVLQVAGIAADGSTNYDAAFDTVLPRLT